MIGAEAQRVNGSTDEDYVFYKYTDHQSFYGSFLQSEITAWKGGYANLGVRLDGQSDISKAYISPTMALQQALLNNKLTLYGSYGVTSRWIPMNEVNTFTRPTKIMGAPFLAGNVDIPDNTLEMERTYSFDAGVKVKLLDNKLSAKLNFYHMKNKGQLGMNTFQVREVIASDQIPSSIKAALVSFECNFPGYDVSQGLEAEVNYKPSNHISVFANASYLLKCETNRNKGINIYEGPMSGNDMQNALNNSIGSYILPYDGKSITPGAYKLLLNMGTIYHPVEDATVNLLIHFRSKMTDPLMKFGMDPQTNHIPAFMTTDLSVSYNIIKQENYQVKSILSAYNLFDRHWQTFVHYPMSGRFLSAGFVISM